VYCGDGDGGRDGGWVERMGDGGRKGLVVGGEMVPDV
jgi:hypothetical protein